MTVTALVVSTSCPTLSFMVGSYTIGVNASTRFENGTCANVKAGSKLALTGYKLGEASVLATNIVFRDQAGRPMPPPEPTRPTQAVEGEGVITSLTSGTACPALTFMIGRYAITLDAATQYRGGVCGDLKVGLKVSVKGTFNGDSGVTASLITVKSETRPEPEAEGEGFVTGLVTGTACPTLQFQIAEYTITVSTSTQFVGGTCGTIALGKKVGVRGTMTGAKTAAASQITIKN
jgi:hypothetical protein